MKTRKAKITVDIYVTMEDNKEYPDYEDMYCEVEDRIR